MKASPLQREIINHAADSDHKLLTVVGDTGSGKTVAAAAAQAALAAVKFPRYDHIILGLSQAAAMRNVVRAPLGTLHTLHTLGYDASISGVDGKHVEIKRSRNVITNIWIMGANDEKAQDRIAGGTYATALVDEAVRCPESALDMLWTRLRVPGAKRWDTANPGPRRHWYKKKVIDNLRDFDGKHLISHMDDNPIMTPELQESVRKGLYGANLRRLGYGEWADAEGRIFPDLREEDSIPDEITGWSISMDWASAGIFAALLFAHTPNFLLLVDERYHDGRTDGVLNDTEHAVQTASWARTHIGGLSRVPIVGDPSTSHGFQKDIREQGFRWVDADNEVDPGIKSAQRAIMLHRVRILRDACPTFRDELDGYVWDPKATLRGDSKPLKQADHGCDCFRYRVHTNLAPSQIRTDIIGF